MPMGADAVTVTERADLLTVTTVAVLCGTSRAAVLHAIRHGRLDAMRVPPSGRSRGSRPTYLVRRTDAEAWRPRHYPRARRPVES
jgi:hypothetical protein